MPNFVEVALVARALGLPLCQADRLPVSFVAEAAAALRAGADGFNYRDVGAVRLRPGEIAENGRLLDLNTHTESCRCMAVRAFNGRKLGEGITVPKDVYAIPLVRSVEVMRRRAELSDVTIFGDPTIRFIDHDPPPHPPIVTQIDQSANTDCDQLTVRARLDCGDREEFWEFGGDFTLLAQQEVLSNDHRRDYFSTLAGLVITISARLREEMARALERFQQQAVEASRLMARAARELAPVRGARISMPRVEDLRLPSVVVEGAPLCTPNQYAAFVEMGRRATVEQPFIQIPRAQHDDPNDAMNYAPPRPRYLGRANHVLGDLRFAGDLYIGVDVGHQSSPVTAEMSERADALLISLLSPEQRRQFEQHGYFELTSQLGNRYRIGRHARSYNVSRLNRQGRVTARYCAYPRNSYALPMADQLIAQMLMLKSDEHEFLRIANRA